MVTAATASSSAVVAGAVALADLTVQVARLADLDPHRLDAVRAEAFLASLDLDFMYVRLARLGKHASSSGMTDS